MDKPKHIHVHLDETIVVNNIDTFIRKVNDIFRLQQSKKKYVHYYLWKTNKIDFLGIVMLYKFLEYSVQNKCYLDPTIFLSKEVKSNIKLYRFHDLVSTLIEGNDIKSEFEKLKIEITNDFIIAPIAMWKENILSKYQWNKKLLPDIQRYYPEDISLMVFQLFIELYSNFVSHADDNSKSIMVAHGTKEWIEIVCVDNGIGIVESLRKVYPSMKSDQILRKAVCKCISSKKNEEHMGYGLWYINEIVKKINGRMEIWSNDAHYKCLGHNITSNSSSYWQGTIIYLKLKLTKAILLHEIENNDILNNLVNFK